ncbi:hypothetical protein E4U41_005252 [Claviceps citrina]|nr:hypothetical protein E4U41_005252 [Claviceps citrina]
MHAANRRRTVAFAGKLPRQRELRGEKWKLLRPSTPATAVPLCHGASAGRAVAVRNARQPAAVRVRTQVGRWAAGPLGRWAPGPLGRWTRIGAGPNGDDTERFVQDTVARNAIDIVHYLAIVNCQ